MGTRVFVEYSAILLRGEVEMPGIRVIVNPTAGRGYAGSVIPEIRRNLERLGLTYDLVKTEKPGDAVHLAADAVRAGYDTIVAVGGDGTTHEVVNGMMAERSADVVGTLACVSAGNGNDFAAMNGVPENVAAACQLIAEGTARLVDVGQLRVDGQQRGYFSNAVGIGFDGLVVRETRKLQRLRGLLMYLVSVLKTIFVTLRPMRATMVLDGEVVEQTTLMMVIANGAREGHTFLIAPDAECDDGWLDLTICEMMPRLQMLAVVPRVMKGTHLQHRRFSARRARQVAITSPDPMCFHVDGEILCDEAHDIRVEVIPHCLRMIGRPGNT